MYGESSFAKIWTNTSMKTKISTNGLGLSLSSLVYMHHFNKELGFYDKYEINFPETSITNIFFGKSMQFEHWGEILVRCKETGIEC